MLHRIPAMSCSGLYGVVFKNMSSSTASRAPHDEVTITSNASRVGSPRMRRSKMLLWIRPLTNRLYTMSCQVLDKCSFADSNHLEFCSITGMF